MTESLLQSLRSFANQYDIPVVEEEVLAVLWMLLRIQKPARVLEIGTAIGYSSIAFSMCTDAQITTIERDEQMYFRALENIQKADLSARIQVLLGDAKQILPTLTGPYDFVFLDGAKAQYSSLFALLQPLLREGSLVCADDVLFHGMVQDRSLLNRRVITIVKRMKKFLKEIQHTPGYRSVVLQAGDGLAVIRKEAP